MPWKEPLDALKCQYQSRTTRGVLVCQNSAANKKYLSLLLLVGDNSHLRLWGLLAVAYVVELSNLSKVKNKLQDDNLFSM